MSISFSPHGLRGHVQAETVSAWTIDPNNAGPRMDGAHDGTEARQNWLTNLALLLSVARAN